LADKVRSNMAKKNQKPEATFEVRFVGPDLKPEKLPLRAVNDVLSAVQDLASGRDPFEQQQVPQEKSIGLLSIRRGSAVYNCVARSPSEALNNLCVVASFLTDQGDDDDGDDSLIAALKPIETLSQVARSIGCKVEVNLPGKSRQPIFAVQGHEYERLSSKVLLKGDTTVVGTVERVGGATEMRCLMRVPGRRRLLYCDVKNKDLVRRLGEHLYEQIAATGTAVWIHSSWRVYQFEIHDFTQPRLGPKPLESISDLRKAGLSAWDAIEDPEGYMKDLRS